MYRTRLVCVTHMLMNIIAGVLQNCDQARRMMYIIDNQL